MSLSREMRNRIKQYMLENIADGEPDFIAKTVDTFGITSNTVYRYLRDMKADNEIIKENGKYRLVSKQEHFFIDLRQQVSEDTIMTGTIMPLISDLPNEVVDIWQYCFSEMVNNVIDHSNASQALVTFERNIVNTTIVIQDNGVGIFRKIMDFYGFETAEDAIIELFKGKLTTDKIRHSGEGIFFTSRILDKFAAVSDGKVFSHSEFDEVIWDVSDRFSGDGAKKFYHGTTIIMRLSNTSQKVLSELFNQYADVDGGFLRTRLPIKNIFPTYPVSRSHAKRLTHRFEDFKEVELDFEGVSKIGQGFAHELFVVFHNSHPDVKLIPYNTSLEVQKMIAHVQADLNE